MISEFGKFVRHIRVDECENLRQMAEKLEVSVAFLSAVEVGKKQVPKTWAEKLASIYKLDKLNKEKLSNAIDISNGKTIIDIDKNNDAKREVTLMFARSINSADQKTLAELKAILDNLE